MSTIEAALNSTATLTAEDIVQTTEAEYLRLATRFDRSHHGRRCGGARHGLVNAGWSVREHLRRRSTRFPWPLAPGITTVFLWGVFWPRGNQQGAMAALLFNVVVGLVYLAIDIPLFGTEQIIAQRLGVPFMQVGWYLFLMSSAVYIVVSLMTPAPIQETDRQSLLDPTARRGARQEWKALSRDPRVMAAILFVVMGVLYAILH